MTVRRWIAASSTAIAASACLAREPAVARSPLSASASSMDPADGNWMAKPRNLVLSGDSITCITPADSPLRRLVDVSTAAGAEHFEVPQPIRTRMGLSWASRLVRP